MLHKNFRKICEKTYFYRLSLLGSEELDLVDTYIDPWPPQIEMDINQFKMLVGKNRENIFKNPQFSSFEWIRNFKSHQDVTLRSHIRDIILFWINANQKFLSTTWSDQSWEPDTLGVRVWNWIALFDFFGTSGSDAFKQTLVKSLNIQFKQLLRSWDDNPNSLVQFKAIKGILGFLCACKKADKQSISVWENQLKTVLEKQLLPDGGHISRNPLIQLFILKDLIDIRAALSKKGVETTHFGQIINYIAPMARLFRHGDGRLARFLGSASQEEISLLPENVSVSFIDMCLSLADSARRPPTYADDMGYIRCVNESGILLFSTKPENPYSANDINNANIMNFEWSYDRQMIVQNVNFSLM